MSESENLPTPPPPSTPKTSAVPLKKETVRITLRSRPGEGAVQPREATAPVNPVTSSVPIAPPPASVMPKKATAPIQLPSAPLPPPAPKAASSPVKLPPPVAPAAPSAPRPPAPPPAPGAPPAATVPMAPPPPAMPRPPSPPSAPGAPPKIETGAATAPIAKTVPLKPMPAAPRVPGSGTGPMVSAPGGAPSAGLPKATVKLQQTQPMVRPSVSAPPSAPVKRSAGAEEQFFNEEKDPEEGLVPLSVVCLLLSAVLLAVQMFGSDRISASNDSPIMVPEQVIADWETLSVDHKWNNSFSSGNSRLKTIPE